MEWATLAGPVESELLIKKSRFLGRVMPVSGRAEAYAEVARLKALHPGAVYKIYLVFQISFSYCAIVLSDEKNPAFAMLFITCLYHKSLFS